MPLTLGPCSPGNPGSPGSPASPFFPLSPVIPGSPGGPGGPILSGEPLPMQSQFPRSPTKKVKTYNLTHVKMYIQDIRFNPGSFPSFQSHKIE